jgi:uncharacterized protein YbjT (DUF2867 family)
VDVILVIGGRSKIGSALIESLQAQGEEVRALVRGPEADAALPTGVEPVVGTGEGWVLLAAHSGFGVASGERHVWR